MRRAASVLLVFTAYKIQDFPPATLRCSVKQRHFSDEAQRPKIRGGNLINCRGSQAARQ